MLVTRRSILSGEVRTREIAVDPAALAAYERGEGLIQKLMPDVAAEDREFIMTGISRDEWDAAFSEE
jgi:hypothetical protein